MKSVKKSTKLNDISVFDLILASGFLRFVGIYWPKDKQFSRLFFGVLLSSFSHYLCVRVCVEKFAKEPFGSQFFV